MKILNFLLLMAISVGSFPVQAAEPPGAKSTPQPGSYSAGPESKFSFNVSNFLVTTVSGDFSKFNCEIQVAESPEKSSVKCELDVESISTGNSKRDEHLRSDDFFSVKSYPKMQFVSQNVSGTWQRFELKGLLTIRGISKPVTFSGSYEAAGEGESSSFVAETTIDREEFQVKSGSSISNSVRLKLMIRPSHK